jgi:hypothetical protein
MFRRRIAIDSNDANIEQVNKQLEASHFLAPTRPPQNTFVEILPHNRHLEELQRFSLIGTSNRPR